MSTDGSELPLPPPPPEFVMTPELQAQLALLTQQASEQLAALVEALRLASLNLPPPPPIDTKVIDDAIIDPIIDVPAPIFLGGPDPLPEQYELSGFWNEMPVFSAVQPESGMEKVFGDAGASLARTMLALPEPEPVPPAPETAGAVAGAGDAVDSEPSWLGFTWHSGAEGSAV